MSIGPAWLTWAGRKTKRERRRGERGWMKITDLRGLKGAGENEGREQKGQGNRGK